MYTNRGEKTKIHPPAKKNTPTKKPKTKQNKKQKEKKSLYVHFCLPISWGFFSLHFIYRLSKQTSKRFLKCTQVNFHLSKIIVKVVMQSYHPQHWANLYNR